MTFLKRALFVFFLICCSSTPIHLIAKASVQKPLLYKSHWTLTLDLKTYRLPDDETIQLYGSKRRRFVTDHWFWGEAGYGAISGKRSGYLEGGLIAGWMGPISKNFQLESRLFLGAGGGGSAPQGGGLIINPTLGLWALIRPGVFWGVEAGYIRFINGDIKSVTLGTGITFYLWELSLK